MDVFPSYSEDQLWGMKAGRFFRLEKKADQTRRRRVAEGAKAVALGNATNPDKAIREYLAGKFW